MTNATSSWRPPPTPAWRPSAASDPSPWQLARRSPAYFAWLLAGDRQEYPEPFHQDEIRFLLDPQIDRGVLIAPRGSAKTTYALRILPWRIGHHPEHRILQVSNTAEQAQMLLREVAHTIEHNPVMHQVFGHLKPEAPEVWSHHAIIVKRPHEVKDPTIAATGVGGPVLSRRLDYIDCDDILDEENTRTEGQRRQVATWFKKTLLPTLAPTGQIRVRGTRWHQADLYGELLLNPQWRHRVYDAERPGPVEIDGPPQPEGLLWPTFLTRRFLDKQRQDMGTALYNCQYRNDPRGMGGSRYQPEWFQVLPTLPPGGLRVVTAVDLAASLKKEADLFAMVTIAIQSQPEWRCLILDAYHGHHTFAEQMALVQEHAQRHQSHLVVIESNAYQRVLPQELRRLTGLPIREYKTSTDKVTRSVPVEALMENGKIFFHRPGQRLTQGLQDLQDELLYFPRGDHDDLADALFMAVEAARGSGEMWIGR